MPSDSHGSDGSSGLPDHLNPRRERQLGDLPPELDPRGRRAAKARQRSAAAGDGWKGGPAGDGPEWRATAGPRRSAGGAVLGLRISAAVLSLAVLLGSGFAWATYRNFTSNIARVAIPLNGSKSNAKNIDGSDQNILIVGNDDRSNATPAQLAALGTTQDGGSENTDTMMLLHVPANGSKATVISFPRDSYVAIPGFGMDKLNAAYVRGTNANNGNKAAGAALLVQTIENLTGLTVDHFVQVNLLGFYNISNAIGGVSVCLNAAQQDSFSGINLPAGTSVIKGSQALAFVRQRHGLPGGDLDRIKRQQYFLAAVFRKLVSAGTLLNPLRLENLLKAVTSSLTVDQTLDPLKLAQQVQDLTAGNVIFTTIPTAGDNPNSPVGDVILVDTAAIPNFIDTLIGQDPNVALNNAKPAPLGSFTVDVLNASGVNGRATANSHALTALGFKSVIGDGTPPQQAATTIAYPKGMEGGAKALAAQVPGASVLLSNTVTAVTLYLGSNGVQVKSLMPAPTPAASAPAKAAAPTPSTTPGVTTAAQAGCIN